MKETRAFSVTNCARCGQDHTSIQFTPFTKPVVDEDGTVWDYWAICPVEQDPILLTTNYPKTGHEPQGSMRPYTGKD